MWFVKQAQATDTKKHRLIEINNDDRNDLGQEYYRHDEKTTNADPKDQKKWFNDVSVIINFCSNDKSTLEVSSSAVDIFQSIAFIF